MSDQPLPQALSFKTRDAVEASAECACFHCLARFPAEHVTRYVDGRRTPICPCCGIDSVLAAASFGGTLPDEAALAAMRKASFGLDDRQADGPRRDIFDFLRRFEAEEP